MSSVFIKHALIECLSGDAGKSVAFFDFLIEMMIHYGLALKEHQSLIQKTRRNSNGNECRGESARYVAENKNT